MFFHDTSLLSIYQFRERFTLPVSKLQRNENTDYPYISVIYGNKFVFPGNWIVGFLSFVYKQCGKTVRK